jgi:hypothetical protein
MLQELQKLREEQRATAEELDALEGRYGRVE